jgi:hypothetical protein
MKKICLPLTIAVFLLICINGLQAQTTQPQPNQLESFSTFLGTWQANVGKDTLEVWDCQQYGKAYVINVYQIVKDQKIPLYMNNVGFDSGDGKIKGFVLWADGNYLTWIGQYNPDKKFLVDVVDKFKPESVWLKFEMVATSPTERIWTELNKDGVKISDEKFTKVK